LVRVGVVVGEAVLVWVAVGVADRVLV
jgi:hypothetical protein